MWKDVTRYSQGDKARKPTAWRLDLGGIYIAVTCSHIYYPGEWVMHCEPFFREHQLGAEVGSAEMAQGRALALVKCKLAAAQAALAAITS